MALLACLAVIAPLQSATVDPSAPATPKQQTKKDDRHQKDIDADLKIGREYSERVRKELPLSENRAYIEKLLEIGDQLSAIARQKQVTVTWGDKQLSPFPYEFAVLKGDDVNAFSLPGGFIYIYEGVFNFAESDDEIAGVVAHEIAHAAFRHVATLTKEQSKLDLISIPLILAAIFSKGSESSGIVTGTQLMNQAMMSGWSVKAEEAADYGGLQYLLASKYNPVGMLTFMERLAFRDRGSVSMNYGIYQSHPPSDERAKSLMKRLNENNVPIKRSMVTKSLRGQVLPGENGTVELWFGKTKIHVFGGPEALTRADEALFQVNQFFDSVPALYELSSTDDGQVVGQSRVLFDVRTDDGQDRSKSVQSAMASLKKVLFDLNYRIWPDH